MNKVTIRQVGSHYLVGIEPVIGEGSGEEEVCANPREMMSVIARLFKIE